MAPTLGIEEEFFLSDSASGQLRQDAESIRSQALEIVDGGIDHELRTAMLEIGTAVCADLAAARHDLTTRRAAVRSAAAAVGADVIATASHPSVTATDVDYTDVDRYQRMAAAFGPVADESIVCGCHVHVQIDSREAGVAVIDRIRPWLAPLIALSSNSPIWAGRDTGYDSWRHQVWSAWPTAGPLSLLGTVEQYERTADLLVASGAAMDRAMLYFDARLSEQWPTVEVRVADVCLDIDDALLIGILVRALVMTAAAWGDAAPPDVAAEILRAAGFVAARSGLRDRLLDPSDWRLAPAGEVLQHLLRHVGDALDETGDRAFVAEGFDRLLRDGTGAARQRAAWDRGGPDAVIGLAKLSDTTI